MKIKKSFRYYCCLPLLILCSKRKHEDKKDQIKALKVAFFTTELDLSTKKLKNFGLFTILDDKQFEIRHQKMRMYQANE
jgi:hypothetical protein